MIKMCDDCNTYLNLCVQSTHSCWSETKEHEVTLLYHKDTKEIEERWRRIQLFTCRPDSLN